jgi:non-ribosomal peptide synthetase component F
LLAPLACGARVIIASSQEAQDPERLFELIKGEGVTLVEVVPSFWRHCIEVLGTLEPSRRQMLLSNQLRQILATGEPLGSDLLRGWSLDFGHPAHILNMYGQAETTGIAAVYPVPDFDEGSLGNAPIGRPIANTRIYILDGQMHLAPMGVTGEIYVGGLGLARGYWNRPDLTAACFVPDPFSGERGARLYRTGDRGYYLPDGAIEFVGRANQEVRTHDVRLGSAEVAPSSHLLLKPWHHRPEGHLDHA